MSETDPIERRMLGAADKDYNSECADELREGADEITKEARARVSKLEARLEIDHVWVSQGDGPLKRVEIPPEKRDEQIDGIECRDETIRLAKDANRALAAKIEEARAKAIEEVVAIAESQLEQYRAMSARLPGDSMSRELATIRAETVSLLLHPIRALIAGSTK